MERALLAEKKAKKTLWVKLEHIKEQKPFQLSPSNEPLELLLNVEFHSFPRISSSTFFYISVDNFFLS